MKSLRAVLVGLLLVTAGAEGRAQSPLTGVSRLQPNLEGRLDQPLRYSPEKGDFVIVDGKEFFNRPLYGGNTAFRVDAGDKPEFSLYLPGRGGNLRLGVRVVGGKAIWLNDAGSITARYRPGTMRYEIHDALLGKNGRIDLVAIALASSEGLVVRVEGHELPTGLELVWGYGGANGKRGKRDGDIGTEQVPIGEYFQLSADACRDQTFAINGSTFTLKGRTAAISGLMPAGAQLAVVDAARWKSCEDLMTSDDTRKSSRPVLIGHVALGPDTPLYLALQCVPGSVKMDELQDYRDVTTKRPNENEAAEKPLAAESADADRLPRIFAEAEQHFAELRGRVTIETPDPFINAASGALNVAADAVWDEPQGVLMHGAVAWRTKLLGWRGPYLLDALGWHDRARRHFTYWAGRQNTGLIPEKLPPADEDSNLARNETGLHSNGDISNSHYDMNLVYIDALFRHLLWTGDLDFARKVWPVIQRHLAWERRLFRREFTAKGESLPLYEAYAAIWASDDLQYNGGGTAHASAYNYYHEKMAAKIATLLGEDPKPYQAEADLIARGMRDHLWLENLGTFAEFKDLLGKQLVHPSAALWTIYHTIDSEVTSPREAWRMAGYIETQLPQIPVRGRRVPTDLDYHVFSENNWMPYSWSINNVVMAENIHTALAFWQAGRPDEAYGLTKSALLAAMYMGICPGNLGSMSYLDVYRRESQRDFGDGSGVLSRALVEGLFGVRPDMLDGELVVAPGFPKEWDHARIVHPDFTLAYQRKNDAETFSLQSRFPKPVALKLRVLARSKTARVTIDDQMTKWAVIPADGAPAQIEITSGAAAHFEVKIEWGAPLEAAPRGVVEKENRAVAAVPTIDWNDPLAADARFEPLALEALFNDRVTQVFRNEYREPRSPYVSLAIPKQGIGGWAGGVKATAEIDDAGLRASSAAHGGRLLLPNGVPFVTPGTGNALNVLFVSQWTNYKSEASVSLNGRAKQIFLLMAGSTNWMQSRLDNGEVVVAYTDGSAARLALNNPVNWWPIDEDYFIDDYQFRRPEPIPPRVNLKTGEVRILDIASFKGQGGKIPGGAATVLELALDQTKELKSLTVRALANEVVIGLMAGTLVR